MSDYDDPDGNGLLSTVSGLRKQLADVTAERDDWQNQYEHERSERQKEIGMQEYRGNTISYIYDKCRNYGKQFDEQRERLTALEATRDDILLKDRGKTNEINILVAENRKYRTALEELRERIWLSESASAIIDKALAPADPVNKKEPA